MDCVVCGHPARYRCQYCARCKKFTSKSRHKRVRRLALIMAWNKEADAFLCHYTGLKLEDYDTASPFYLTFDHPIPGDESRLFASARFVNELKSAMTEAEFRANIPLLAEHFRTGAPIDRSLFTVGNYHSRAKKPKNPVTGGSDQAFTGAARPGRGWKSETCGVCGKPPEPGMLYCARCRNILLGELEWSVKVEVLKAAYDPEADGFRCHYTGFLLDLADPKSPWYLNFDHTRPGHPGEYAVACQLLNDMKTQLSDEEFRKVVVEIDRHFTTGEPYDRDVINFEYWDRPRMPAS